MSDRSRLTAISDDLQGPAGLWPSPEYAEQVARLRAAVGETVYLAEIEATAVQLGVRLTDQPYVLLGVLDFPRPDPSRGLAPHLILLDDGRGVNLGRIARITRNRPFSPGPADVLFLDGRSVQALLTRERHLSPELIAQCSRHVLGEILGEPAAQARLAAPIPGSDDGPPNTVQGCGSVDPATYHAWYQSPRGASIAERELRLLAGLLDPHPGETLLDLGCGTGYFSSAFRALGLAVTGLDPDPAALRFLRARDPAITLVAGAAESLPFADGAFDSASAVTSLCFVARPEQALAELWRATRRTLVLGLLHRRSLLYLSRRGRGGYRGARWDLAPEVLGWTRDLTPARRVEMRWAVFLPSAGPLARWIEGRLPASLPFGAFLAVALRRPSYDEERPSGGVANADEYA